MDGWAEIITYWAYALAWVGRPKRKEHDVNGPQDVGLTKFTKPFEAHANGTESNTTPKQVGTGPDQIHIDLSRSTWDVTHPGCFVVLFDYQEPTMRYCKVTAGDGGWRRYTYDIGEYEVPTPSKQVISSIAAVQGEIFFIASAQEMCAITIPSDGDDDPEFLYFDVALAVFPEGMSSGRTWLVESGDQLFLVCVCFVGFDAGNIGAVVVYRMDFSTEAWCRVHDVGDVVFLLEDANMAAACPASPLGITPNQVYFMKNLVADDADLCAFDIGLEIQETTQVHQHDDFLLLYRKPFWILPPVCAR